LFSTITRLRRYADAIWSTIVDRPVRWLVPPDATAHNKIVAWTQADTPHLVFLANTDLQQSVVRFGLPMLRPNAPLSAPLPALTADFSTAAAIPQADQVLAFNGKHYRVTSLAPGEGRAYRVYHSRASA
jgi:hypothetical protein